MQAATHSMANGAGSPDPLANGALTATALDFLVPESTSVLAAIINHLSVCIVVCDGDRRVLLANSAALRSLERGPLRLSDNRLVAGDDSDFSAAVQRASRGGLRQLLAIGSDPDRVFAYVVPLDWGAASSAVMILMTRLAESSRLVIETLACKFSLTHSERDVLQLLIEGKRANRIADERGVALTTVRSQIGSIRAKLGADSILSLVGLIAAMPPMASALRHLNGMRPMR